MEWQAATGLGILASQPALWACLHFAPARIWAVVACLCSYPVTPTLVERPHETWRKKELAECVQTLWECAGLQLCIFSTLSERPAFALVVGLSYSFLRSCVEVGYAYWYYWMERDLLRSHAPEEIEPTTVYTDMHTGTFAKCLAAFCAQTTLFVLFFIAVTQQQGIAQENENTQILQFCLGACISSVVRLFDTSFVKGEYRSVWKNYITYYPNYFDRNHLFLARFLMSFLANSVLSMATLFLLPVVLMNADNFMEFVKDATCVLFIAELDTLQIVTAAQKIPGQDLGRPEHLPRPPSEPSHFSSSDHEEDDGKDDPFDSIVPKRIPPAVAWERLDPPGSSPPKVKPEPDLPKVKEPSPEPDPQVKKLDPPAQKGAEALGADLPRAKCSFLQALPLPAPVTCSGAAGGLEPPWCAPSFELRMSRPMQGREPCTADFLPVR